MSDADLIGGLYSFAIGITFVFFVLLSFLIRRFLRRNSVWIELETARGETIVKLVKPNADRHTVTVDGHRYFLKSDAFTLYDGGKFIRDPKARFRYVEGKPFPYRYGSKKVTTDNPGHNVVRYEDFDEAQAIPSESFEVFMKQKLFADAYSSRLGLIFAIILFLLFVTILAVVGLYAR